MSALDQEIQVRRRLPRFGQVPDTILEDRSISLETRAVLGYLVGRSEGFRISVGRLCFILGIKDSRWRRIRQEMETARYYRQTRRRHADGTFSWGNEVFDEPYDPSTIPPKPTDGKPTRGEAIHGKPTDLPYGVHHKDSTIAREGAASPPPGARDARELSGMAGGGRVGKGGHQYAQTPEGIRYTEGDPSDAAALARISTFPADQVKQAIQQATQQDPRGRAFPASTLRVLLRRATGAGGGQADLDAFLAGLEHAAREEAASPAVAAAGEERMVDGTYSIVGMED